MASAVVTHQEPRQKASPTLQHEDDQVVTLELHDVDKQIKRSSHAKTPSHVWHQDGVGAKLSG